MEVEEQAGLLDVLGHVVALLEPAAIEAAKQAFPLWAGLSIPKRAEMPAEIDAGLKEMA